MKAALNLKQPRKLPVKTSKDDPSRLFLKNLQGVCGLIVSELAKVVAAVQAKVTNLLTPAAASLMISSGGF